MTRPAAKPRWICSRFGQCWRPGSPVTGGNRRVRSSHENGAKISPASGLVSSFTVAAVMTFGSIGATVAQEAGGGAAPGVYERFAFDAADTDGDGFVSEAELARDAAAGFSGLDQDRSGTLTPDELGPHDPAMFARVDAN